MIPRIIPVLLLSDDLLYKTIRFKDKKYVGDPINCIKIFNDKEVDELIVLDIGASKNKCAPNLNLLSRMTCEAFMPLAYGGGIHSLDQALKLFNAGIEKLVFNSSIFSNPSLLTKVASSSGSSSVIASIDFLRDSNGVPRPFSYLSSNLLENQTITEFARYVEDLGVGEIFLNSVHKDGCLDGYDLDAIYQIASSVDVPVTVCGGAGSLDDLSDALAVGASAPAAGSLFIFKGKYKAVLPNYPSQSEIESIIESANQKRNQPLSLMKPATSVSDMQECTRCVMNNVVDKTISFDQNGLCHHCQHFDSKKSVRLAPNYSDNSTVLQLVDKIKSSSGNSEYDCLIGLSGGVDSSYVAYLVKSLGLNPLAVHFDNGWNSELAVKNIESIVDKLNIDLVTHVVDWEEFSNLQKSFLYSLTPDGEIPTDHGIFATMWRQADLHNIKYIISGMNYHTESMSIPSWSYGHSDWKYISSVHRKYVNTPLSTYPHFTPSYLFYLNFVKKVRTVSILNYIHYDKQKAIDTLKEKLNWRPYGGKHHESIYTRFYQGYFLPKKFGIDKRYCHLSDLINIGQLSRQDALSLLEEPTYDLELQQQDLQYVISKLRMDPDEFQQIFEQKILSYQDYRNNYGLIQIMRKSVHLLRSFQLYPK